MFSVANTTLNIQCQRYREGRSLFLVRLLSTVSLSLCAVKAFKTLAERRQHASLLLSAVGLG